MNQQEHFDFPFPGNFTFVDVEIPNINNNCICAISMIVVEDHEEKLRHTELINPKTFFSAPNMRIHKISRQDVADARTFPQFWAEYEKYFTSDYIIAAHNSMSDISVINKDLNRINKMFEGEQYIDTMDIMMDFYFKGTQRKGDLKLNNIARRLGIYLDHHNPESDVNACYEIVRYMHKYHDLDLEPFIKEIPQRKLRPSVPVNRLSPEEGRTVLAETRRSIATKDPETCIKRSLAASKGDKAARHGDFEKAIFYYEVAISRRFNSPGVYMHLSELYHTIGMDPEAERVLKTGISNLRHNHGNYHALRRELARLYPGSAAADGTKPEKTAGRNKKTRKIGRPSKSAPSARKTTPVQPASSARTSELSEQEESPDGTVTGSLKPQNFPDPETGSSLTKKKKTGSHKRTRIPKSQKKKQAAEKL